MTDLRPESSHVGRGVASSTGHFITQKLGK
jgi:hypothetical protein